MRVLARLSVVSLLGLSSTLLLGPSNSRAWGYEGHRVVASIARSYLTSSTAARVDALLAADTDPLTPHTMIEAATWADTYRNSHRETAEWHFVDLELDRPDFASACYGFPKAASPASAGPMKDCLVNRLNAFTAELADPATPQPERIIALKFVLHLVGDIHQPLHASDNHDRGGNCVLVGLGGPRTVNLHSYWDTALVEAMGKDPSAVATRLRLKITQAEKTEWERGEPKAWALESNGVARSVAYTIGSTSGCGRDAAPVALTEAYEEAARRSAEVQLEKAGVRLAMLLNRGLGGAP